jgi:hypothetical protein
MSEILMSAARDFWELASLAAFVAAIGLAAQAFGA